jgi:hypothetical protein
MRSLSVLLLFFSLSAWCLANEHLDSLTTTDGITYKDVTLTKVEPDGLRIIHATGVAKVGFERLSPEIQKKYGYDPAKAVAFKQAEAARLEKIDVEQSKQELQQLIDDLAAKAALQAQGKVVRVYPTGVLVKGDAIQDVIVNVPHTTYDVLKTPTTTYIQETHCQKQALGPKDNLAFIECDASNLSDGVTWATTLYPVGNYSYTDLAGKTVTVPKYTQSQAVFAAFCQNLKPATENTLLPQ